MNLAAVDFGTLSADTLLRGVVAAVLYFVVGIAVLVTGFVMADVLTPGSLRRLVFIERRPTPSCSPRRCTQRSPSSSSLPS